MTRVGKVQDLLATLIAITVKHYLDMILTSGRWVESSNREENERATKFGYSRVTSKRSPSSAPKAKHSEWPVIHGENEDWKPADKKKKHNEHYRDRLRVSVPWTRTNYDPSKVFFVFIWTVLRNEASSSPRVWPINRQAIEDRLADKTTKIFPMNFTHSNVISLQLLSSKTADSEKL